MSAFTDYAEAATLNHWFRNTAVTSPTTVYLALFTVALDDAGAGTEVTGGSYARQAITFGAPTVVGGANQVANSVAITFPAATANWGDIVGGAIYDALTVGNPIVKGVAIDTRTINNGDQYVVVIGNLRVRLD
jgi:hypothetical protein